MYVSVPRRRAPTCTYVCMVCMQVVTHLCYSDFQDIMGAIDDMDGEVMV